MEELIISKKNKVTFMLGFFSGDFNHFIDLFENARVRTGLNIYNQETKTLSVAVKSDNPIVVQQSAVILVQLGFYSVDIDSFFEENLVLNIAMVLNLDPSQIRVVNAVNEDTLTRRKRSLNVRKPRAVSDQVIYDVEIGDPPQPQKVRFYDSNSLFVCFKRK